MNISNASENKAIFSRRKVLIVLELLHLKMEVTVSEPCGVIRVCIGNQFHGNFRSQTPSNRTIKSVFRDVK